MSYLSIWFATDWLTLTLIARRYTVHELPAPRFTASRTLKLPTPSTTSTPAPPVTPPPACYTPHGICMSTPKKPRTAAQIEASRRNGARSRGPKTPEGRSRSSQNARTHGLSAQARFVLSQEDQDSFDQLLAGYIRTYEPANAAETQLVFEITRCAWRLERLTSIEAALLDLKIDQQRDWIKSQFRSIDPTSRVALAFASLADNTSQLSLLCRYEASCRRGLVSATNTLARLQNERRRSCPAVPQVPENPWLQNEPGRDLTVPPNPLMANTRPQDFPPQVPFGFPLPEPGEVRS